MVEWKAVGVVGALAIAMLVSGCAESVPVGEESEETQATETQGNATVDGGADEAVGGQKVELSPAFTIAWDGNLTSLENGTYTVPADTNITFNATGTANATAWAWTVGNDTYEGAVVDIMFPVGNHSVLLAVSAGNASANTTIPVSAYSLGPVVRTLVGSTDISFSTTAPAEALGCISATQALEFPAGTATEYVTMTLDPGWTGLAFDVAFKVALRDAAGTEVAMAKRSGGTANLVLEAADLDLPAGSYTAYGEFCTTAAGNMSLTVTGRADHYA